MKCLIKMQFKQIPGSRCVTRASNELRKGESRQKELLHRRQEGAIYDFFSRTYKGNECGEGLRGKDVVIACHLRNEDTCW